MREVRLRLPRGITTLGGFATRKVRLRGTFAASAEQESGRWRGGAGQRAANHRTGRVLPFANDSACSEGHWKNKTAPRRLGLRGLRQELGSQENRKFLFPHKRPRKLSGVGILTRLPMETFHCYLQTFVL